VVAKQAGASIPTCSTENGGAKFRKKEWQRIRDQIKAATIFAQSNLVTHFLQLDAEKAGEEG